MTAAHRHYFVWVGCDDGRMRCRCACGDVAPIAWTSNR